MESFIELLLQAKEYILNPKLLIDWMLLKLGIYVYVGLFFIIFAETGLAVGFFLPGDSLLVVAGLFAFVGINTGHVNRRILEVGEHFFFKKLLGGDSIRGFR